MPSLVDEKTLTIAPHNNGPLLLDGPKNFGIPSDMNFEVVNSNPNQNEPSSDDPLGLPDPETNKDKSSVLLFGE